MAAMAARVAAGSVKECILIYQRVLGKVPLKRLTLSFLSKLSKRMDEPVNGLCNE